MELTFPNEIVMAGYAFKSSPGKYPITYNLFGGSCAEKAMKLVEVKNEAMFSAKVSGKVTFTKFCFEVLETSGYLLSDGIVQQRTVVMRDIEIWKCEYITWLE